MCDKIVIASKFGSLGWTHLFEPIYTVLRHLLCTSKSPYSRPFLHDKLDGCQCVRSRTVVRECHHVLEFDRVGTQQGDDHTYSNVSFPSHYSYPVRKEPFFSRNQTTDHINN